jgi:thiosulfate dehydrogenase
VNKNGLQMNELTGKNKIKKARPVVMLFVIVLIAIASSIYYSTKPSAALKKIQGSALVNDSLKKETIACWIPADINSLTDTKQKELVSYGKELIAHTSKYFGPKGSVLQITNGLNCQNCHLQAGTAAYANNYGSVASQYPKFRARSGTVETIYRRVNDCFERSLNGKSIDTASKEMQAIVAYIYFIGSNVEKGKKAAGSGFKDLAYLDRAADTAKGRSVFINKCQRCHQPNGQGQLNTTGNEFIYPALWGNSSYNDAAGLYRISNVAKYVKYNMPQGTTYLAPQLTDEEAWDVAAFINSQPRPHKDEPNDWPDITKKPVDHPFGPYADHFSQQQHKYGPYQVMEAAKMKKETASINKPATTR